MAVVVIDFGPALSHRGVGVDVKVSVITYLRKIIHSLPVTYFQKCLQICTPPKKIPLKQTKQRKTTTNKPNQYQISWALCMKFNWSRFVVI